MESTYFKVTFVDLQGSAESPSGLMGTTSISSCPAPGLKWKSLHRRFFQGHTQKRWCCPSVVQSRQTLWPHGLRHARLPCPSPSPRACSNSCHWVGVVIQPSCPLLSQKRRAYEQTPQSFQCTDLEILINLNSSPKCWLLESHTAKSKSLSFFFAVKGSMNSYDFLCFQHTFLLFF